MNVQELQEIVLRNEARTTEILGQIERIHIKEQRVDRALRELRQRIQSCLDTFDRDRYKATDQRLLISTLASEILIFDRLGYDLGTSGPNFLLAVSAFLEGRNRDALEYFEEFLKRTSPEDRNYCNACYLAGMITYNRREFQRASEFFGAAFIRSAENNRDWLSKIYTGEIAYFLRASSTEIEGIFRAVKEALPNYDATSAQQFIRATLYLKWGNCYAGTFRPPKTPNSMVNNQLAIQYYKLARASCPHPAPPESLLPVVIDYSLAQALLLGKSVDMDLGVTPSQLFADVFQRLRRIVLLKREELILAQCYLMLGTCAYYSTHVSKDIGEIYLEYARHQTLVVPPDVCFYSPITKELLNRDELVGQIDYYSQDIERQTKRRA